VATLQTGAVDEEAQPSPLKDLVVITGFSGAGKSTAMNVFEDAGYFCVDNLPPGMIGGLVDLFRHPGSKVELAAVVCDVRGGEFFEGLLAVLDDVERSGVPGRVLFLDADDGALLTRYKETRRRHPLAADGGVAGGIVAERDVLAPLRERADLVVDTTNLSAAALRRRIVKDMLPLERERLTVSFTSFGFKHGPLRDADLIFDVRFLPNPHYVEALRSLTGRDDQVVEYIGRDGKLDEFYDRIHALLDFLLPQYLLEGKAHLTIAIGCTGGRHRSVAIAEHLAARYQGRDGIAVDVLHRDTELR
jgi:RNase adapter protein RapZ